MATAVVFGKRDDDGVILVIKILKVGLASSLEAVDGLIVVADCHDIGASVVGGVVREKLY